MFVTSRRTGLTTSFVSLVGTKEEMQKFIDFLKDYLK